MRLIFVLIILPVLLRADNRKDVTWKKITSFVKSDISQLKTLQNTDVPTNPLYGNELLVLLKNGTVWFTTNNIMNNEYQNTPNSTFAWVTFDNELGIEELSKTNGSVYVYFPNHTIEDKNTLTSETWDFSAYFPSLTITYDTMYPDGDYKKTPISGYYIFEQVIAKNIERKNEIWLNYNSITPSNHLGWSNLASVDFPSNLIPQQEDSIGEESNFFNRDEEKIKAPKSLPKTICYLSRFVDSHKNERKILLWGIYTNYNSDPENYDTIPILHILDYKYGFYNSLSPVDHSRLNCKNCIWVDVITTQIQDQVMVFLILNQQIYFIIPGNNQKTVSMTIPKDCGEIKFATSMIDPNRDERLFIATSNSIFSYRVRDALDLKYAWLPALTLKEVQITSFISNSDTALLDSNFKGANILQGQPVLLIGLSDGKIIEYYVDSSFKTETLQIQPPPKIGSPKVNHMVIQTYGGKNAIFAGFSWAFNSLLYMIPESSFTYPTVPQNWIIDAPQVHNQYEGIVSVKKQQNEYWCWAANIEALEKYYLTIGTPKKQCDIVNQQFQTNLKAEFGSLFIGFGENEPKFCCFDFVHDTRLSSEELLKELFDFCSTIQSQISSLQVRLYLQNNLNLSPRSRLGSQISMGVIINEIRNNRPFMLEIRQTENKLNGNIQTHNLLVVGYVHSTSGNDDFFALKYWDPDDGTVKYSTMSALNHHNGLQNTIELGIFSFVAPQITN